MFTNYFGNWFANWFGDEEDEAPDETGGNGGGSGKRELPWGDRPVDYPLAVAITTDDDVLDAAMFAVGAGFVR